MAHVILAFSLLASASAALFSNNTDFQKAAFATFVGDYHRVYLNAKAEAAAFSNFVDFLKLCDERNAREVAAGGSSAVHGITKFADMSQEQFERAYLLPEVPEPAPIFGLLPELVAELPPLEVGVNVDWTGKYTTPIKDQGYCGSCWAHSVAEQLESDYMREHRTEYVLSPQQLTSCDTRDNGCSGGDMKTAYSWIESNGGLVTESAYPYVSKSGRAPACEPSKETNPVVSLSNYYQLRSESSMASYVGSTGPVSIGVDASEWNSYTGDIVKSCGNRINHAVQAVGLNTAAAEGYWKVRNSWGVTWGERGYIRLAYGENMCNLDGEATYVKSIKA